ncbi:unnamed protein product [Closterium sp. NIES-53]
MPAPALPARHCCLLLQPYVLSPAAAALGAAATRMRCPALPCPALAPPCPECCYVAIAAFSAAAAATALATATAAVTAAMATPIKLALDAEGHPIQLEGVHQYLQSVTQDNASLFEHTLGSLTALEARAEPAADAGELVQMQVVVVELAGVAGAGNNSLRVRVSLLERLISHPSTVLSSFVVPSYSSGLTEGGDPAAADTATSRCLPRLETPPGFPPRMSSPPLQPVAVDFGGPGVVRGGDAEGSGFEGAGSRGAGSRGADSGGARIPLVGGVGGIGLDEPSSSLPEPTPTRTTPPLLFPPLDSPLPVLARYSSLLVSLTGRRVPVSCAASLATPRVPRDPVVLPLPTPSSLPAIIDPVSDLARAARPTNPCCLAALVIAPASLPAAASALVAELAGFVATCRCAYLAGLVSTSSCPTSVGGEVALGCDDLEDREFELEYLPYPLGIRNRYVAPGIHHPVHWWAARRVLRYLVRLASRT